MPKNQPQVGVAIPGVKTPALPKLGQAPDFTDNQRWFNTPGNQPLTLAGPQGPRRARGLLDLHLHQLHPHPALPQGPLRPLPPLWPGRSSASRPRSSPSSRRPPTSSRRSTPTGLRYPVVQDNRYGTWNAYQNQYWPAEYLIDASGPGPPHPVRRGRLQAGRGGGARAALRGRRAQPAGADDRHRDHAVQAPGHAGDLSQPAARRGLRAATATAAPTSIRA